MTSTVETVDISALFLDDCPERNRCDAMLWAAFKRTGAVVITGYPDADKVDARAKTGLSIFDLTEEEKARIAIRQFAPDNANQWRGYWPPTEKRLLKNEQYDLGPSSPMTGPNLAGIELLAEPNALPDPEPVPEWTATAQAHYAHLNHVAQAMIRSIGRSAGFAEAEIAKRFNGANSTLRFLSYPGGATGQTAPDGAVLSAGRHTDSSGLSLLWQEDPGLQAEGQDGVFRDIPVVPNAISVHVGDVMTRMTDGIVPATPHRVISSDTARRSVGFFLEPALGASVTSASNTGQVRVEDTYAWQLLETLAGREMWADIVPHPDTAGVKSSEVSNPA